MPVYEYQCNKCGKIFEEFQSFSAEPITKCPFCQGEVKRLISKNVGLVFKGSGFYATDYRSSAASSSSSCGSCSSNNCSTCGSSNSQPSSKDK